MFLVTPGAQDPGVPISPPPPHFHMDLELPAESESESEGEGDGAEGPKFTVVDTTEENPVTAMVASITKEENGVVTTFDEVRHGLEDGDVSFSEVKGMEEINTKEFPVKVLGPYTFSIGNTTEFGQYERGGVVLQVKQPKVVSFKPVPIALKEMEHLLTDFAIFLTPQLLHVCYQTMHAWNA